MNTDFVDIRIVSLEDDMMVPSPNDPTLFYVFLKLSQAPPPLWEKHFANSRKISRHTHWRKAWIDRKFIVVECMVKELEQYHLNDLKQDIAHANKHYGDHVRRLVNEEIRIEKSHLNEQEKLRNMKGRISFE